MSPAVDTALTVVGFVLILPGVVFAVGTAPMFAMAGDSMGPNSQRIYAYLVIAMILLPALSVLAVYVAAVVAACLATDLTFYYPLVALAAGAAVWAAVVTGLGMWIDRVK